jgi:Mrp family chromosome partitioning ATPase
VFALSPQVGLASVIDGEAELKDVIQESGIPGLSIIPCGPIPSNPAELLTSPRFKEVLDLISEQHDFVLLDTPPLLAVTDPSVVAPRVDGVLLAIRVNKNARPDAVRAKEILYTLGVPVLGVVVNGIDIRLGNYGYGHYHYGYSNGHHNGESYYANGRTHAEAEVANGSVHPVDGESLSSVRAPRKGRNGRPPQGLLNRLLNRQ